MNNEVTYVSKFELVKIMFLVWYANYIMAKSYKAKGKHSVNMYVCFHGSTGIGKTQIMQSFSEFHKSIINGSLFTDTLKLNLSMMDGSDFEIPVADHVNSKINRLCAVEFSEVSPQVIEADELNRYLNTDTINAFSRLVLDKEGSQKPSDGSLVVACANSISNAGTKPFPPHMIARGMQIYLTENLDTCVEANLEYMQSNDYPDYMMEAYKHNPCKSVDDFTEIAIYNNRTFEYAMYVLQAIDKAKAAFNIETPDYIIRAMLAGLIGLSMANQTMLQRTMKRLPTLAEVINDPDGATIPDVNLDMALRKKFVCKLCDDCKGNAREAKKLIKYILRFSDEFARYGIEHLASVCPKVTESSEYKDWYDQSNS